MEVVQLIRDNNITSDEDALSLLKKARSDKNNIISIFGISDKYKLQRLISPKSLYRNTFILLDTNNIDPILSTDTKPSWQIINTLSLKKGTITITHDTRDLVGMRIYPMTTQLTVPVGETGKTYINPVVNINHNFTVLIHEFQGQSYIGRDGRKFHFVLFPQLMNPAIPVPFGVPYTPNNPYIELVTSGKMNGWFWFRKPMTEFSRITVSIGNPFDLVKLSQTVRTLIPLELIFMNDGSIDN